MISAMPTNLGPVVLTTLDAIVVTAVVVVIDVVADATVFDRGELVAAAAVAALGGLLAVSPEVLRNKAAQLTGFALLTGDEAAEPSAVGSGVGGVTLGARAGLEAVELGCCCCCCVIAWPLIPSCCCKAVEMIGFTRGLRIPVANGVFGKVNLLRNSFLSLC